MMDISWQNPDNEHSKVILIIQELYLDFSYLQHWEAPSQAGGCARLQVEKNTYKKKSPAK